MKFFVHFQTFFVDFRREITEKRFKWTKKVENGWKKVVWPTFRCYKHLKASWNAQQVGHCLHHHCIASSDAWLRFFKLMRWAQNLIIIYLILYRINFFMLLTYWLSNFTDKILLLKFCPCILTVSQHVKTTTGLVYYFNS